MIEAFSGTIRDIHRSRLPRAYLGEGFRVLCIEDPGFGHEGALSIWVDPAPFQVLLATGPSQTPLFCESTEEPTGRLFSVTTHISRSKIVMPMPKMKLEDIRQDRLIPFHF